MKGIPCYHTQGHQYCGQCYNRNVGDVHWDVSINLHGCFLRKTDEMWSLGRAKKDEVAEQ